MLIKRCPGFWCAPTVLVLASLLITAFILGGCNPRSGNAPQKKDDARVASPTAQTPLKNEIRAEPPENPSQQDKIFDHEGYPLRIPFSHPQDHGDEIQAENNSPVHAKSAQPPPEPQSQAEIIVDLGGPQLNIPSPHLPSSHPQDHGDEIQAENNSPVRAESAPPSPEPPSQVEIIVDLGGPLLNIPSPHLPSSHPQVHGDEIQYEIQAEENSLVLAPALSESDSSIVGDPASSSGSGTLSSKSGAPLHNAPPYKYYSNSRLKKPFTLLQVFFGTDRQYMGKYKPEHLRFANKRGNGIVYGTCVVSIPSSHKTGELEGPSSLLPSVLYRMVENPTHHVFLKKVTTLTRLDFLRIVRDAPGRKAFVFIHGYNNSFEDAARRTAQIAFDTKFNGTPIFYSWPSKASPTGYPDDEDTIELSHIYLRAFLRDLAMKSNLDSIYLIAHSMGNRALTRAFVDLKSDIPPAKLAVFKEIILTAPDIGAEVFRKAISPALVGAPGRITLYASSNDKALQASKKFHGFPRLGDTNEGLVIVSGIESIDASNVGTGLFWNLNHSYVGDSPEMLKDLHYILVKHRGADRRQWLQPVLTKSGRYWRFKPRR